MQLNDKDIKNIIEEVVKRYLSSSENSEKQRRSGGCRSRCICKTRREI